ncbi:hypothetical protein SY88_01295 [Clostridiales bacterium PH28_bin88]|nr:hypothetical protein SY88_01295 [Clostridiales bacterium PH28_bin88]
MRIKLKEIRGQDLAVQQLLQALQSGKVPHAYLFLGPDGVGKETAAKALARALNCTNPVGGDACGMCLSCRRAAEGNHPDIHVLAPQGSVIKIDQVRELQRQVGFSRYEGKYQVVLFLEADRMKEEAANALLKLLEEPPENTVLILISAKPAALLQTIQSRCVPVRFVPLSPSLLVELLVARGTTADQAELLSGMAGGSIGQALALAGDARYMEARDQALDYLERLTRADAYQLLSMAAELEQQEDLATVLDWMARWYRDILVWQQMGSERLILNRDCWDRVQGLKGWGGNHALALKEILLTRRRLQENVNKRLVLEAMLLRLKRAGRDS